MKRSIIADGLRRSSRQQRWLLASVLLLILAALNPGLPITRRVASYLLVFDITQSMNVRDMDANGQPITRLEYALLQSRLLLDRLPCGNYAGIAIFAERKTLPVLAPIEICAHRAAMDDVLSHLDWRMAWAADSHLYYGVYSALDEIKRMAPGAGLVFFSDWHQAPVLHPDRQPNYGEPPGGIAGLLVGVGGTQAEPVPKLGEQGRVEGYWTAEDATSFASAGTPVLSVEAMEDQRADTRNAPQRAQGGGAEYLSWRHDDVRDDIAKRTGLRGVALTAASGLVGQVQALPGGHRMEAQLPLGDSLAIAGLLCLLTSLLPGPWIRRAVHGMALAHDRWTTTMNERSQKCRSVPPH